MIAWADSPRRVIRTAGLVWLLCVVAMCLAFPPHDAMATVIDVWTIPVFTALIVPIVACVVLAKDALRLAREAKATARRIEMLERFHRAARWS